MRNEAICVECGRTFTRRSEKTVRCPKCAKKASKKRAGERKKAEREAEKKLPPKVCPFCGSKFHGRSGYCRECIKEGFDTVHKMFGSTNGWDKKPRTVVELKEGWRAGGVIGGCASNGKWDVI